jgi:hypothetical protein
MPTKHQEEWQEFYTEAGFRHGFDLGAKTLRDAVAPHLPASQLAAIDAWLAGEVAGWRSEYLSKDEPPRPPKV